MTMRAAAVVAVALGLRRLFNQPSSISGGSVSRSQQLQQQIRPRCYFNPHLGFSDPLARARAALLLLNPTPCRPRGSSPLHFSSLSGAGKEAEEEAAVLDMEAGTVRCPANYAPLSPISFIERAAAVYGARAAVVYGERRRTWAEARDRCVRVAAALATRFGVARGDVVSARKLTLLLREFASLCFANLLRLHLSACAIMCGSGSSACESPFTALSLVCGCLHLNLKSRRVRSFGKCHFDSLSGCCCVTQVEEVLLLSLVDPTPAWRPGHRSC